MTREIPPEDHARRALFARTLGEAIAVKGLKLDEIASRLAAAGTPVSSATLSYWQNGHSMPTRGRSLGVVRLLEHILDLTQGTLLGLLSRPVGAEWRPLAGAMDAPGIDQVLRQWGLTLGNMHEHKALQDQWVVRPDGGIVEYSRAVSQVTAERESAFPVVLRDMEEPGAAPTLRCLEGCSPGRVLDDREQGTFIGEVLLPRPMGHGELYWTEIALEWEPSPQERRSVACGLGAMIPLLTLDITFEGEVPDEVLFGVKPTSTDETTLTPLQLLDHSGQVVLTNAGSGLYWFEW